eukprot:757760-Hanusia_phi.AAC.1
MICSGRAQIGLNSVGSGPREFRGTIGESELKAWNAFGHVIFVASRLHHFAYSAIIAGTVRYASAHSFGSGVGLSSSGAGDGPG